MKPIDRAPRSTSSTWKRRTAFGFYDIEFKGGQGEMDVAEDGTILDIATVIEMKNMPEPVAAAIRTAAKGKPIKQLGNNPRCEPRSSRKGARPG